MPIRIDRERFEKDGFTVIRNAITPQMLDALRRTTDELIDRSRQLTRSDDSFDLEPDHSAERPRLRRINHPVVQAPIFWELASSGAILDIIEQLIGPDIKFHHSKLNTKVGGGGTEIGWHQDFAFFPHTNDDLVACGIALDNSTTENGCLLVVPGTHRIGLLNHRLPNDEFVGKITDSPDGRFDPDKAVPVELKAGDMSIHHAMVVHGSLQNNSPKSRRLLIYQYAATDAIQLDRRPLANEYAERVLRGKPLTHARLAGPVTLRLRGAVKGKSLFDAQKVAGNAMMT